MIEIKFEKQDVTVRARLLREDAPVTTQAIVDSLKDHNTRGLSYHSIYSGQEFYVYCDPLPLPLENHVVWPKAGQLLYYYFPENMYAGMHVHKDRIGGRDGAEIALWYGHGDLRYVTESGIRGNMFAEVIEEDLDRFYEAGDNILANGREQITISYVGE